MQEEAIAEAMQAGAPTTCATCVHWHANNGYCGIETCGGPPRGRDFPDYEGPIPREKFVERCLICGDGNITHMIVGLGTKFSLCWRHRKVFEKLSPIPDQIDHTVTVIELSQ